MQTLKANLGNYRNEEHFQFQTEFKDLVLHYTPETLNIEAAWAVFLPLYNKESAVLDLLQKSSLTVRIADADHYRDRIDSGLFDTVKGATNHFNPAVKEAADRIQVILDRFGNINRKSYDEQTAAINSLITDLNNGYADDVATLGIGDWLAELQAANNAFVELMKERYSEEADKPDYNMKTARAETDPAYRTIINRINALIIVNGEETYKGFVKDLNQRIDKYNLILAQREGRNAKKGEGE